MSIIKIMIRPLNKQGQILEIPNSEGSTIIRILDFSSSLPVMAHNQFYECQGLGVRVYKQVSK